MKPLKDIGTLIKPEFESMTQFEPFIQLSLQERRELVREVWEAAYDYAYEKGGGDGLLPYHDHLDLENFIKEQGL